jgi:hypothetical protein
MLRSRWMARHFGALLALVNVIAACGQIASTTPVAPGSFETLIAQGVGATLTADVRLPSLLPTSAATPSPAAPPTALPLITTTAGLIPTAGLPTSRFFTDAVYELSDERLIDGYALRVWRNGTAGANTPGFDRLLTLTQTGQPPIQIEFFDNLDPLTGSDITGDGRPEVIVETYSGGAHCCFSTLVYSLGERAEKILETPAANCSGVFRDLDNNAVLEFVTCDDRFAYAYCPFAASPVVTAVLAYEAGEGYAPAGPRFAELYTEPIAAHTALAQEAQGGALGEWDATTKCAVLPLVLDYLYSGQTEQAWSALEELYRYPDAEAFRDEIEQTIEASPLYAGG